MTMTFQKVFSSLIILSLVLALIPGIVLAASLDFSENFDTFSGAGFDPAPGGGQLDSDDWRVTGLSDGDLAFGATGTSGDYARGVTTGGVTFGGIYAFDLDGGDFALGFQPSSADLTPGSLRLKVENTTGSTISEITLNYDIVYNNDQGRANSLNFEYSATDMDGNFTQVAALDFTSPEASDTDGFQSVNRSAVLPVNLPDGSFIVLSWTTNDVSGSGSRDELGIDNVSVIVGGSGSLDAPFINEIHYDNTGGDKGEGVEIAGPAGTDLTGWSIALYNGDTSPTTGLKVYDTIALSGVLPNEQNGYGTLSFPRAGIQNGGPDGLALVDASSSVVQFLSYEGSFAAIDGPAVGVTSTDIGVFEPSSTLEGNSLQLVGSGTSYGDFTWADPKPNTFGAVNTGQFFGVVVNAPVLADCGDVWLNTYEGNTATRGVRASDSDGTVVAISISVDPIPTTGTITLQNFVAATAAGETATGDVIVDVDVPAGVYEVTVTATNNDDTPQEGSCTFNVDVDPFLTIGEVQGVVEDTDSGTSHSSPYEGEYVAVQGVVYEKTQEYRSSGGAYYGLFIQNTEEENDGDPKSSDGIFVFLYIYPTLPIWGGGYYEPQIGDELVLVGQVEERYNNTRLNYVDIAKVVRDGVVLDDEIPAFDVNPPAEISSATTYDDIQDANRYWERHEGMRAQIPADSIVLNGRSVFASSFDSEVYVARADSLIAQRSNPYERRSFRDVHPLDDIPTVSFDNDNPYRILMGGFGLKAAEDDTTALLAPARAYDTLDNAPIGGVYYNFGKYSIQVEEQLKLTPGVDPAANGAPEMLDSQVEYSVVVFNVENLYDYIDDPFDGCDFQGNSGCPGVTPPFDYTPSSDDVYQARLVEMATQIIDDLHGPDIILAQEAEDQDICTVTGGDYVCGTTDDADGKPDTLQELATVIASLGGPTYDAAYDRDGADDRGIVAGYLYRTDRVELLPAMADHPVLGSVPQVDYPYSAPLSFNTDVQNPKVLNAELPDFVGGSTDGDNVFTRSPQVAWFRIWRDSVGKSVFEDIYLINNHFSSGPDGRVEQRTEQANYNAAIVDALQMAYPGVYVGVGGDLNVYPRPDDPFPTPNESDQLAGLYNQGLTNLWDIMLTEDAVSAYSYIYQGQTQTLDQIFVAPSWLPELTQAKMAHINADFAADYHGDGPRGTSDHDPVFSAYSLLPTLNRLEELVKYYDANGMVTGKNTTRILLDRLERAQRFQQNGKQDAYISQLQAFIDQIYDFTPQFITQEVADVLVDETTILLSLP